MPATTASGTRRAKASGRPGGDAPASGGAAARRRRPAAPAHDALTTVDRVQQRGQRIEEQAVVDLRVAARVPEVVPELPAVVAPGLGQVEVGGLVAARADRTASAPGQQAGDGAAPRGEPPARAARRIRAPHPLRSTVITRGDTPASRRPIVALGRGSAMRALRGGRCGGVGVVGGAGAGVGVVGVGGAGSGRRRRAGAAWRAGSSGGGGTGCWAVLGAGRWAAWWPWCRRGGGLGRLGGRGRGGRVGLARRAGEVAGERRPGDRVARQRERSRAAVAVDDHAHEVGPDLRRGSCRRPPRCRGR